MHNGEAPAGFHFGRGEGGRSFTAWRILVPQLREHPPSTTARSLGARWYRRVVAPTYRVEWVAEERVVEITYEDVQIHDDASFDAWRDAVLGRLESITAEVGGPVPLLVGTGGLELHTSMGERYSKELAMPVAKKYASLIARFGDTGVTSRVVAVEAMRRTINSEDPAARAREYAANTFATREEALAFIRKHR